MTTVSFDSAKRAKTIRERGLDFADAAETFGSSHTIELDERHDYGETRCLSTGQLRGRIVVLVWTPRDGSRRIISMRYANEREIEKWRAYIAANPMG